MTQAHVIAPASRHHPHPHPQPQPRRVLVTGAAGRIGSHFARHSHQRYTLTLMEHPDADVSEIESCGTVVRAPLSDLDRLKELMAGHDTVVHLAADAAATATWDSMLPNNIIGTYNAMTAAVAAGCRRLIYASSIHAVSGYAKGYQVHTSDPVNPGDLYGVTKCFGEAMGRFIALQHGVSTIAIRIGAFQPVDKARQADSLAMMNAFLSHRDLTHLLQCCIDDHSLQFAIVHGLSNNRFNRLEIESARELLNYKPQDDFTDEHPALSDLHLQETVSPHSKAGGQTSGLQDELPND